MKLVVFKVHIQVAECRLRERLEATLHVLAFKESRIRWSQLVERNREIQACNLQSRLTNELFTTVWVANRINKVFVLIFKGRNKFIYGVDAGLAQQALLPQGDSCDDGDVALLSPNTITRQLPITPRAECDGFWHLWQALTLRIPGQFN